MKKAVFILLITSIYSFGQSKIELKDLTFSIPNNFYETIHEEKTSSQNTFFEIGKIYSDTLDLEKFPKIQYQYYEMIGWGRKSSKKELQGLNDIVAKDFKIDTLFINELEHYSIARYTVFNKSIIEAKSLGSKGYLNIQYFSSLDKKDNSFLIMKEIVNSINHNQEYISEYDELMDESGDHSKSAIIFLTIALVIFFGRKLIKKTQV